MSAEQHLRTMVAAYSAEGGHPHDGGIHAYIANVMDAHRRIELLHADEMGVVGVVHGRNPNVGLMYQAHTDSVRIQAGWHTEPLVLTETEDGSAYQGLATSDDKAAAALNLHFAEEAARRRPPISLIFEFVSREEVGGWGTVAMAPLNRRLAAEYPLRGCLLGEPTDARMFGVSHNGAAKYLVTAEGKAGHGAQYIQPGATAMERLFKFIEELKTHEKGWRTRYVDPLYALPTVNMTSFEFGVGSDNVINQLATGIMDMRMPRRMIAELDTVLASLAIDHIQIAPLSAEKPAAPICRKSAFIRQFLRAAFPHIPEGGLPYATDMNGLQRAGWPTIHFGPGDPLRMHEPDEGIEKSAMARYESIAGHQIPLRMGQYALACS